MLGKIGFAVSIVACAIAYVFAMVMAIILGGAPFAIVGFVLYLIFRG